MRKALRMGDDEWRQGTKAISEILFLGAEYGIRHGQAFVRISFIRASGDNGCPLASRLDSRPRTRSPCCQEEQTDNPHPLPCPGRSFTSAFITSPNTKMVLKFNVCAGNPRDHFCNE